MTSQGIYYLIRALVALVATTRQATRWPPGCWATPPQSGKAVFR